MTIKEAQNTVDSWIKEYGVRYFSELTNMTVLTEEVENWLVSWHENMATKVSRKVRKTTWAKK